MRKIHKHIQINFEKCTGCGTCISKCEFSALTMTHNNGQYGNLKKAICITQKCTYCLKCIDSCRVGAIKV